MRIQTCSRTVYAFAELSERAQAKVIEDICQQNGEYWQGSDLYDDFEHVAECLGVTFDRRVRACPANQPNGARANNKITDPCIWWSGFSNQGDGACFEGRYEYIADSVAKTKDYAPVDAELHRIAEGLAELQRPYFYQLSATVKHTGHYSHKYSTTIEWAALDPGRTRDRDVDADTAKAGDELLRDFMEWMYRALETEYDYQTSDKCARAQIADHGDEWEFTEDGERVEQGI